MTAFIEEVKQVSADLSQLEVRWALVGALAYSVHAEPRTTKDIDVAIAVSDKKQPEQIAEALKKKGYGAGQLLMHMDPVRRLGIRVMVPTRRPYSIPLDLLVSSCGIEKEIVEEAITVEVLPSLSLPVARFAHVLAMKLLSQNDFDRIRDKADVNELLRRATSQEIDDARKALSLIMERGFNRDKDLIAEMEASLALVKKSSSHG